MAQVDVVLIQCRQAVMIKDDDESLRRFDALVAKHGWWEVSAKWQQACNEFDREHERG